MREEDLGLIVMALGEIGGPELRGGIKELAGEYERFGDEDFATTLRSLLDEAP